MNLRISHRTRFDYSDEIADSAMELRVRPVDGHGQRVLAYDMRVEPRGPVRAYRDVFDNWVETWNHRAPHRSILVEARSTVETGQRPPGPTELAPGERWRYMRHDGPVQDHPSVREMAAGLAADDGASGLNELAGHIHRRFVYEPNVTTVNSTVTDLIELGRGVCQDFAHLFIAACRAARVPARYVSGYIFTGDARPQATHAWAEAWLPGRGWIAADPTNPHGGVNDAYVRIAVGRDYRDVPPTRGIFRGAATEALTVEVTVERLADAAAV